MSEFPPKRTSPVRRRPDRCPAGPDNKCAGPETARRPPFGLVREFSLRMYNEFFGFRESPFNITPDPRFLFLSDRHREAFNHILFGIQERKGFIQLTGEIGAGKTTVCRAILRELGTGYKTALVLNPCMTETPLSREETERYVFHRLKVAGANSRPAFTPWAFRKVYGYSRGVPRLINAVCDKALLCGYVAGADRLTAEHVRRAIRELEGEYA